MSSVGPPYSSKSLTIYYSIDSDNNSEVPAFFTSAVNEVIENIESFLDINFVEVSSDYSNFDIIYSYDEELNDVLVQAESPAFLYEKDFLSIQIIANVQYHNEDNLFKGSYGYVTIIHEIGHGLGLSHPPKALR